MPNIPKEHGQDGLYEPQSNVENFTANHANSAADQGLLRTMMTTQNP